MTKYASELGDFQDLLSAAARSKKIPAAIIEKDYYLTRALHAICTRCPDQFILKGGTGLSKGWKLLDRFSEDLDLLLRIESETGPLTMGERERRLKAGRAATAATPGFTLLEGNYPASAGEHRTAEFRYPGVADDVPGLGKTIKLEMGTRGSAAASFAKTVQSLVGEHAAEDNLADLAEDLQGFDASVQDVTRTFVEKLFAVHAAYTKDHAANATRHYYDLFKLCGLAEVEAYAGTPAYRQCVAEVKAISQGGFPGQTVIEGSSFSQSPALAPVGQDLARLERNYRSERHLFFIPPPSLSEIFDRIAGLLPRL